MITVQMSQEQVRAFAMSIRDDIVPFVEARKKEYEEYLQNMEINERDYGD